MVRVAITSGSPAAAHGIGLFETLLVVHGRVLQLAEHRERMRRSAHMLALPAPEAHAFEEAIALEVSRQPPTREAALRCCWLAADSPLEARSSWRLTAEAGEIPAITLRRRSDARAITLQSGEMRALPQHKLTSYAICVLALRNAVVEGANEALFLAPSGGVLEGTSTNVFAVRGDTIVTAPVSAGILPGTLRGWVLREAPELGLAVEERVPSVEEVKRGAFLTSSLTTIAPLRAVDGIACAEPGDAVRRLQQRWSDSVAAVAGGI